MTRFPDEEPDVDEIDDSDWPSREECYAADLCALCGHSDHRARSCPNVPPGGGS